MRLGEDKAVMVRDVETPFDIPHRATPVGQETPLALTLIAPRDSAILILQDRACGNDPVEAILLTQEGASPILLTGCCRPAP